MSGLEVKRISEKDWEIYKYLRLKSLGESPDSFGSTLKKEAAFPDEVWKARLKEAENSMTILLLLAYYNEQAVALTWGVLSESHLVNIYQMWVAPEIRGKGIARALVSRVLSWANERKANVVLLFVTTTNSEAIALYKSVGFYPDGKVKPLREGSGLIVQSMTLNLGEGDA
jgi:ribosomal protein S18 acetylase RimI-like enzyme